MSIEMRPSPLAHYQGVAFTSHALDAMLARHANLNEIVDLVLDPAQTYEQGDRAGHHRRVHQKGDLAAVVSTRPNAGGGVVPVVITVLLRRSPAWTDADGRPSGKRLSRGQRSRIAAIRRNVCAPGMGRRALDTTTE